MPGMEQTMKSQPWKAHWPPKHQHQEGLKGHMGLGFKKGETMVMDGNSSSTMSASSKAWSELQVVTINDDENKPHTASTYDL